MDHRPRGRAVVISSHYFLKANLEVRDGAEFDEENICKLFTKLYFDVKLYRNKSANVCFLYFTWFLHWVVLMNCKLAQARFFRDI